MDSVVGKPLDRVDGPAKVTGDAIYAVEHRVDALLHAVLVGSTVARGRIVAMHTDSARAAPGVRAVITHENRPALTPLTDDGVVPSVMEMVIGERLLPLDGPEIYYAGQHIAVVVADSPEEAAHAASLVRTEIAAADPDFPDWSDPEAVMAASRFARPGFADETGATAEDALTHRRGDPQAALAAPGSILVDAIYTTPIESHCTMETSGTLASWAGDRLTVYESTQWTQGTQRALAKAFSLPAENVHVVCDHIGGAFGCKAPVWGHTLLAAAAARVCGKPVSLPLTRKQMFTAVGHRPPTFQRVALAAREDGKLLAALHDTVNLTSTTTDSVEVCGRSTRVLYSCDNVTVSHGAVVADLSPATWLRAPGDCPGSFALETAMDEMAVALEMDPVELRLRNYAEVNEAEHRPWSGKHLRECYAAGIDRFGWEDRDSRPGAMREGADLIGWGMATAFYGGIKMFASATARVDRRGRVVVSLAGQDLGTGSRTIYTQIVAGALGLDADQVQVLLGDSRLPRAWVAGGSAATASNSEALMRVSAALRDELVELAIRLPGSPLVGLDASEIELSANRLTRRGAVIEALTVGDLLELAGEDHIEARADSEPSDGVRSNADPGSFGAHFCEVRIDADLPRVRVTRVVSVMDIGRVINPKTASSQISGGVIMGIGMAVMEEGVRHPDGRMINDNLADYAIPVHADIGSLDVVFLDRIDREFNSLGVRGAGEIGITGIAAAIGNAVHHATGFRFRTVPITPARLIDRGIEAYT